MSRIFVTGMGIISAIGKDLDTNRQALKDGKCGIRVLGLFPSRYSGILPCGEIGLQTEELRQILGAGQSVYTRTTLLAIHAFEEAIRHANWDKDFVQSPDTALVSATTVGGMCLTDELYQDAHLASGGSPHLSSYDGGSVALHLQSHYGLSGMINSINTACSSSANAIMYGARLIRHGFAKRAIVGGVDSLAKFTLNGFNALHILAPDPCRPFDQDRKGLNLGEGAAFLVLERAEDIHNRKVYAEYAGYGNSNDSYHPSSLSSAGDGPFLSMEQALIDARLDKEEIGYINAHGTGTENNDESESRAMIRLFENPPEFSSTKSNTGHTLGAAGAVEAVYSIMNLVHQEVYAGLHFNQPIQGTGLHPVVDYGARRIEHVMSNSFGFGGNCTSLIFSKA
ncbi:MAG: beta-ketoacyl-[acyl-carrier-protein] synthase family protein [Chitinophagales bacterium]